MLNLFISYKRADHDWVRRYISEIEKETGASCWIDMDSIETSEQFASVICHAIDEADVFLFMHSASHTSIDFQSDWTVRELNYAMAKKKRIVLVKMDDTPLDNMFLMLFGGTNNIQITDSLQKQKLFADIRNWANEEATNTVAAPVTATLPQRKTKLLLGTAGIVLSVLIVFLIMKFCVPSPPPPEPQSEPQYNEVSVSSGVDKVNGFMCVDLDLPSGTKWARCNVGANEPWEFGDYFAWGEVTPNKAEYTSSNLKYYQDNGNAFILLKYADNKTPLAPEDDAATVNMGKGWRMPTIEETQELVEYCRWERALLHGVLGEKATSTKNGNSIFFPYAGFKYLKDHREKSLSMSFWTSTLSPSHPERAYYLYSGISGDEDINQKIFFDTRYIGTTIRAVTK